MAVVQISKIQIRRGKKNQGTGMPQLASGELAWAIDTQELFIGNGAISEGAPFVGNTKILTDKDSLLEIAAQYQYKYDSQLQYSPVTGTILRTLQNRLDDGNVNARNFGILPSAELAAQDLDQTEKIQAAINSIAATTKVTLEFDPGEYQFINTIVLPSNVSIKGSGKGVTIFKFAGMGVAFDAEHMSEGQVLTGFTITLVNNNSTGIKLQTVRKQNIYNIRLESGSSLLASNNIGINLVGNNSVVPDNKFLGLDFSTLTYGVYAENGATFSTISNSTFEDLYIGVYLKNASYYSLINNIFDNIAQQAFYVEAGTANYSKGNKYKNVGTSLGSAVTSIIKFVTDGNASVDDIFERRNYLETTNTNPYRPDLEGTGLVTSSVQKITLPSTPNTLLAFRLPLNNATAIKVDYIFQSSLYNQVRKGTLDLIVDKINNRVQLSDDYEFVGTTGEDALIFTANLENVTLSGESEINVRINYKNLNVNDVNTFTYTYSILS